MSILQFYWKLPILIIHRPDLAGVVRKGLCQPWNNHTLNSPFSGWNFHISLSNLHPVNWPWRHLLLQGLQEHPAVSRRLYLATTELGGMKERWQGTVLEPVCQGNCPLKALPSEAAPGKGRRGFWWLKQGLEDLLPAAMLTHPANLAKTLFELWE